MPAMDFPNSPINGQTTTDGRYYFDSSVGSTGAWRSTPLPVGGLPAGSIMAWGTNTPPANWLLADGSAVSRSVYSSLFAVIGTQYGAGDGTTTFNLPDLRGRVPVGRNGGTFGTLGATGGAETHTLTEAQMPSHTHSGSTNTTGGHKHGVWWEGGADSDQGFPAGGFNAFMGTDRRWALKSDGYPMESAGDHSHSFTTGATGSTQAHNNLQPYQVVNYIIKFSAGWTAGDSELATRLGVVEQRQILSPNYVLNGGFDIWQRGTSIAVGTTFTYTADRTFNYRQTLAGGMTVSRQPSGLPGIQYCARIQRDSGNTSTQAMWSDHNLESAQSIPLAGKTVTYSFYARAGANFSPAGSIMSSNLYYSTGIDGKVSGGGFISLKYTDHVLTTSWQRFSVTVSVPSNSTQFAIQNVCVPTGTAGANDWYEITGVQLEEGSIPTPFRRNAPSIAAELAACQRYYYRLSGGFAHYLGIARGNSSTSAACVITFKQTMRAVPSSFESASLELETPGVGNISVTGSYGNFVTGTDTASIALTGSGLTTGATYFLRFSTNGHIAWSAEL